MRPQEVKALAQRMIENISRVIVGKEDTLELLLAAVIARGHVLLEDVPGTGKTVMAKSLAKSLSGQFSRIQFTPDLLPADITGTRVYRQDEGRFAFHAGPIFANIVLADEINRATPRTQSALLECMEERQVTEGGETHALPTPFLVIATQNPVETQGTFPLPEAQMDRFLMKLTPGYPTTQESLRILERFLSEEPLQALQSVCDCAALCAAQAAVQQCEVSVPVRAYMTALCEQTRADERVQLGVSPRGLLSLMRACQAYALVQGRAFVTPDDVQALSVPVLAHRVIPRGLYGRGDVARLVVEHAVNSVPVPTEARDEAWKSY